MNGHKAYVLSWFLKEQRKEDLEGVVMLIAVVLGYDCKTPATRRKVEPEILTNHR
jgi:hypothetical protein